MAALTNRITSKAILVEFLAGEAGVAQAHVETLAFATGISAGTYKLRINGKLSAAITFSATIATHLTAINAALDAVLGAGIIVATGASNALITLTATVPKWYTITQEAVALTGNSTTDPDITENVTTQGAAVVVISTEISKFSYQLKDNTVDVTAISEYEATEIPVKQDMTFSMSIYEARQNWPFLFSGQTGIYTVYEEGKVSGKKYFSFRGVLDGVSKDFPDHEKVEMQLSGKRQGKMIVPFDSVYP